MSPGTRALPARGFQPPRAAHDSSVAQHPHELRTSPAVHRTIVLVDIENFSDPRRTYRCQVLIRAALYRVVEGAFLRAGISWRECDTEDRGDGLLILAPAHMAKEFFATRLPPELAAVIAAHNDESPEAIRFRVRLALHAGEITYDAHGVSSPALVHAFRLLNAPAFKQLLTTSPGPVGVMVSSWYFDEVIQQLDHHPTTYDRVSVRLNGTIAVGWVRFVCPARHLPPLREPSTPFGPVGDTSRAPVTRRRGRHRRPRKRRHRRVILPLFGLLHRRAGSGTLRLAPPIPAHDDEVAAVKRSAKTS